MADNRESEFNSCNSHGNQIAKYTRLFFSTIEPDELKELMAAGDQTAIITELHKKGTITAIVRSIARSRGALSANANVEMVDSVEDYTQTATLMLLTLAKNNRLRLHLTPGEIAGYICQWIEQKTTRRIRSEFKSRNTLAEKAKDIEEYSDLPGFDDVLIARQTAMRDNSESADIISIGAATVKGKPGKNGNTSGRVTGDAGKVMRMKELKSRPYQTKIKKDSLKGVFSVVCRGLDSGASGHSRVAGGAA